MKLEITIPESLSEITLEQHQKYNRLVSDNEASQFVDHKTIEIFCNINIKDVMKLKVSDVHEITEHLKNVLNTKPKLITRFKHQGKDFGFIPNLEEITTGEFIDIENYLSDVNTFHKAFAVLYRPITSSYKTLYNIEDYETSEKYSDLMKSISLEVVFGATVFFSSLLNDCVNGMIAYTQSLMEQSEAENKTSLKNGGGFNLSTQLHKEIYSNLIQLQNFN